MLLRLYTFTPLCRCAFTPLCLYAFTPLSTHESGIALLLVLSTKPVANEYQNTSSLIFVLQNAGSILNLNYLSDKMMLR